MVQSVFSNFYLYIYIEKFIYIIYIYIYIYIYTEKFICIENLINGCTIDWAVMCLGFLTK